MSSCNGAAFSQTLLDQPFIQDWYLYWFLRCNKLSQELRQAPKRRRRRRLHAP